MNDPLLSIQDDNIVEKKWIIYTIHYVCKYRIQIVIKMFVMATPVVKCMFLSLDKVFFFSKIAHPNDVSM